jgi:peptide methionine sulfoxide reductase MsrB
MGLGDTIIGALLGMTAAKTFPPPCVMGDESIMSPKAHGTSATPVQENLRWNVDRKLADRICNYNRHYAESSGYWESTTFLKEETRNSNDGGGEKTTTTTTKEITFYDSNTGKPLFVAPRGRSFEAFVSESLAHGWPSFRDEEVVWENVRCLGSGEAVSVDGTHLGHNLPDRKGSRYCINIVSIAGRPTTDETSEL